MVISTNAKTAQRKTQMNIDSKTLIESENTIEQDQNNLIELDRLSRSQSIGDRRINSEAEHILRLLEQLKKVLLLEPTVKDAVIQKALHTTRTTTSLLKLLGSVNLATSNDTKKSTE
jgi:hypothetical protein